MPTLTHQTLKQIADEASVDYFSAQYVVRSRGIKADTRAGNTRLYSPAQTRRILREIASIRRPDSETESVEVEAAGAR